MNQNEETERRTSKKTSPECKLLIKQMALCIEEIEVSKDYNPLDISIETIITVLSEKLPEPRLQSRCCYKVEHMVLLTFIFILMGFRNCCDFAWACAWKKKELKQLGLIIGDKIPSHDSFLRILKIIDSEDLCESFKTIFSLLLKLIQNDLRYICIDGQYIKGSDRKKDTQQPQLNIGSFNVFDAESQTIITSVAIDSKDSEIVVAQKTLELLTLKNTLICADALHAQTKTTEIITNKGGSYLITLKDNQPSAFEEAKKIGEKELVRFNTSGPRYHKYTSKKIEKSIYLFPAKKFTFDEKFAGLTYVVLFRKYNTATESTDDLWLITSEKKRYKIFSAIKLRWSLENNLHRDKDMILDQDKMRYTDKNLANNLAIINDFALQFIKIAQKAIEAPSKRVTALVLKTDFIRVFKETIKVFGKKKIKEKMFPEND